ncbi:MAG: hypothetical protein NTW66_00695 [Candidatus Magasanikbacteria bacterium]|nr:hypothetical protein [Candidatus Magasanikbacteria bacterium]
MDEKSNKKYVTILLVVFILGIILVVIKFFVMPKYFSASVADNVVESGQVVEVQPIADADFALDSSAYSQNAITIISNFEKSETTTWQGNGVLDEKIFYEGARSIGLISTDRKAVTITLEKNLDLTNMKQIEFMLHVTDTDAFETAIIDFGDLDLKSYYRYSLANLKNGWNLIQIPREKFIFAEAKDSTFDWSQVAKVRFYALSRPGSIFLARLDILKSINNLDFLNQWRVLNPSMFFSLADQVGKPILLARNIGASVAILKDIENTDDYIFSATVSPQSAGRSGLFVRGDYNNTYGYYLLIGGEKKSNWQILKRNKAGWSPKEQGSLPDATLAVEGSLTNMTFARDKKYWLRAESGGDLIEFYFSTDGQKYEKLGEMRDAEFRGGGIGIAVIDSAQSLFDDFQFKKK